MCSRVLTEIVLMAAKFTALRVQLYAAHVATRKGRCRLLISALPY
jgi:hypothetical protein